MNNSTESEIQDVINIETEAWNQKSTSQLLSIFHPDMVWVWPTDNKKHDPINWISVLGKFDLKRWQKAYDDLFSSFELKRNIRKTQKIFVTKENDGAFAVVDIDTLWVSSKSGEELHWQGRTCKTYVKTAQGWKMIAQTGVLDYSQT